jgi:hypothetical protein
MYFGKILGKNIHSIHCKYHNQTIFQMYPTSPHITTKDVKKALTSTKRMKPYDRLKYFHKRGMHYSRCIKYIHVVEQFQKLYEQNCGTITTPDYDVSVYEYDDNKPMSIQDIGAIIDEILKDMEDN